MAASADRQPARNAGAADKSPKETRRGQGDGETGEEAETGKGALAEAEQVRHQGGRPMVALKLWTSDGREERVISSAWWLTPTQAAVLAEGLSKAAAKQRAKGGGT